VGLGEHQAAREAASPRTDGSSQPRREPDASTTPRTCCGTSRLEKELRIAAGSRSGRRSDADRSFQYPPKCEGQPAVKKSGLRLPFAPCGAKTAFFDLVQLVPNLLPRLQTRRGSAQTTASIKRRAIEILLGSLGNCNTSNHFASAISAACSRISRSPSRRRRRSSANAGRPRAGSRSSGCGLSARRLLATSRARHCSSDSPARRSPPGALYMRAEMRAAREEQLAAAMHQPITAGATLG